LLRTANARISGRAIASLHAEVKPGDVVTMMLDGQVRVIEVIALPSRRGPTEEARACYADLAIDAGAGGI
jgi:ribosome-associated heat shock protein Hsp15